MGLDARVPAPSNGRLIRLNSPKRVVPREAQRATRHHRLLAHRLQPRPFTWLSSTRAPAATCLKLRAEPQAGEPRPASPAGRSGGRGPGGGRGAAPQAWSSSGAEPTSYDHSLPPESPRTSATPEQLLARRRCVSDLVVTMTKNVKSHFDVFLCRQGNGSLLILVTMTPFLFSVGSKQHSINSFTS